MSEQKRTSFGPNAGLVDEMYERYRADPSSVGESWQDFFADYGDGDGKQPEAAAEEPEPEPKAKAKAKAPAKKKTEAPKAEKKQSEKKEPEKEPAPAEAAEEAQPIRGAAARI